MAGSALQILQNFRTVEEDQKYTRLVELFADDAVYYDPFFGPQRGRDEIQRFMEHMEKVVPGSGARFAEWHIEADTTCGWADWNMVAPDADGVDVAVPGQSLYRLRDGEVIFVADYVDGPAYQRLRGEGAKDPDHVSSMGLSASPDHRRGAAHETLSRLWAELDAGRLVDLADAFYAEDAQVVSPLGGVFTGRDEIDGFLRGVLADLPVPRARFEPVDIAGDDTVAWVQWWYHVDSGKVPGLTLYTLRDGVITFARDVIDRAGLQRATAD